MLLSTTCISSINLHNKSMGIGIACIIIHLSQIKNLRFRELRLTSPKVTKLVSHGTKYCPTPELP